MFIFFFVDPVLGAQKWYVNLARQDLSTARQNISGTDGIYYSHPSTSHLLGLGIKLHNVN